MAGFPPKSGLPPSLSATFPSPPACLLQPQYTNVKRGAELSFFPVLSLFCPPPRLVGWEPAQWESGKYQDVSTQTHLEKDTMTQTCTCSSDMLALNHALMVHKGCPCEFSKERTWRAEDCSRYASFTQRTLWTGVGECV